MTNLSSSTRPRSTHVGDDDVETLAHRALQLLNDTSDTGSVATPFALLFALTDAFLDVDSQARHDMLARIMRRGVSPQQIVDEVIPATARYLGQLWMQDRLSFAEVTIGTARLQETVRAMTIRRQCVDAAEGTLNVLLVVPRSEDHTLGIFVLAEQFRSLGCHVEVSIGNHAVEVAQMVRDTKFDLIGVSCGGRRSLSAVRDLVKSMRGSVARKLNIAVGGAVNDLGVDVKAVTGADQVCTDAKSALQNANLELPNFDPSFTS